MLRAFILMLLSVWSAADEISRTQRLKSAVVILPRRAMRASDGGQYWMGKIDRRQEISIK